MLNEKIYYDSLLPVKVSTVNIENYPMHYHDDMELIYVLEGNISVHSGCVSETLGAGDIAVINRRELHSLCRVSDDNMVMMLNIDGNYYNEYYSELLYSYFWVDMDRGSAEGIDVLQTLMASIMMELLQKGYRYEEKIIESVHNLIECLVTGFRLEISEEEGHSSARNYSNRLLSMRLKRMMEYIYENFTRKLTLNEIAENEGLSLYYMSHIIKESTGFNFQDILNYVRVEATEPMVLNTRKKMGAIAENVGFSAVRYFTKHFELWFGMHPLDYRKKYGGKTVHHRSAAEVTRAMPGRIEESIKRRRKQVYADYVGGYKLKPVIVNINSDYIGTGSTESIDILNDVFSRDVNRVLAAPLKRFIEMDENLIMSGYNYVVTTKQNPHSYLESLSIIVYNIDDKLETLLKQVEGEEELLDIVESYDNNMEVLFKFKGFSGTYRVIRYQLDKEKIVRRIKDSISLKGTMDIRESLIAELMGKPAVTAGEYKSTENMSIVSSFEGIGVELILVDKAIEE